MAEPELNELNRLNRGERILVDHEGYELRLHDGTRILNRERRMRRLPRNGAKVAKGERSGKVQPRMDANGREWRSRSSRHADEPECRGSEVRGQRVRGQRAEVSSRRTTEDGGAAGR